MKNVTSRWLAKSTQALDDAKALLERSSPDHASAASRAAVAIFNAARAALEEGRRQTDPQIRAGVEHLAQEFSTDAGRHGLSHLKTPLLDACNTHWQADFTMTPLSREYAERAVGAAEAFIQTVTKHLLSVTREQINKQCLEEYEKFKGKIVLVRQVECYDLDGNNVTINCDPPAIARVDAYHDPRNITECVTRWMDAEHCDPIYDISILETHPAFENETKPSWVYGTSRTLSGKVQEAPFIMADETLQADYRIATALYTDTYWENLANKRPKI